MNLQQLYYFRTIATIESYSRASEELYISQSTLSHAISSLEEELGISLFYKSGRNIKLTQYGKTFLDYVIRGLYEIDNGKEAMQVMSSPFSGTISLSFVSSLSKHFIPKLIYNFKENKDFSRISFSLRENQTIETIKNLEQHIADIGFGTNTDHEKMAYYPIYTEELAVVVPKIHPLAKMESISLRELNGMDYIGYAPFCGTKIFVDRILIDTRVELNTVFEVPTDEMVASMVSYNLGIGIMPHTPELENSNLKILKIRDIDSTMRTVYMFWLKDYVMLPAAKKFRDFIIKNVNI
ncbi:LysR family transcriptional regulator [Fusobacterium sp. PH5-44]|uniref:LysR family transcriptional regulator n=1 Tax=unclassified Fusobacterium TaxID=2648384 RepID=UPI003D1B48CE